MSKLDAFRDLHYEMKNPGKLKSTKPTLKPGDIIFGVHFHGENMEILFFRIRKLTKTTATLVHLKNQICGDTVVPSKTTLDSYYGKIKTGGIVVGYNGPKINTQLWDKLPKTFVKANNFPVDGK